MLVNDQFNLNRFIEAQAPVYEAALAELEAGRKRTHWMWFIFPQLKGLGHSSMAQYYGISSLAEAKAYLNHPILSERLIRCTETVLASQAASLHILFGSPDDIKFCSCMTLFALASTNAENPFEQAITQWYKGKKDKRTLTLV